MIFFLRIFFIASLLSGCVDFAVNHDKTKQFHQRASVNRHAPGEIYTMRGGLGGIFSKGMNRLESTLENDNNIPALSTVWFKGGPLSKDIMRHYKDGRSRRPIILAGHSLGANEQINIARTLNKSHIPVALLITVDPVIPATIPPNVCRAINFYKSSFVPLLSGLRVRADNPQRTHLENIDVTRLPGVKVNHFNIDSSPVIQQRMLKEVIQALNHPRADCVSHAKISK